MDALLLWCIISAIMIFLVAAGGAFLPKFLKNRVGNQVYSERYTITFRMGNIFSGGVMLSAGLVHLLAESVQLHGQAPSVNFSEMKFPLAPFLTALGCLITLTMDVLVDIFTGKTHSMDRENLMVEVGQMSDGTHVAGNTHKGMDSDQQKLDGVELQQHQKLVIRGMEIKDEEIPYQNGIIEIKGDEVAHVHEGNDHVHGALPTEVSFLTGLVLAAALSVHSVLEGAALGAQQHASQLQNIFIAIIAHKGMAAYALGAALLESKPSNTQFWVVVGTFCLASPIGIFVGYGLSGLAGKAGLALSALAAGTFLYVALIEVIPKELSDPKYKVWKMVFLWLGFSLMSMIAIWI